MKSFTLIEMLVVVVIIVMLVGLAISFSLKVKRNATVVSDGATIRNKVIDAVGRGAIRKQSELDHYIKRLNEQMDGQFRAK